MSDIDKIRRKIKSVRKPQEFKAVLGRADGTVKFDSENVYVTLYNGDVIVVYNGKVPLIPLRKVIIGYEVESDVLQVLRFDLVYNSHPHASVMNHKDSHAWWAHDAVEVSAQQIMPLLPRAAGGMVIRVFGGDYIANSIPCVLANTNIDLTAEIPASGAEWVSVFIDENKSITFVHGANKANRNVLLASDKVFISGTAKLLFSAKMYVGMTGFIQTRTDTDIFDPRFIGLASASIGGGITDITYAGLVALIGSSTLVVGSWYRITDYATVHYILDANYLRHDIITGDTEPLIVFAISANKISKEAKSEAYPEDVIYYDWDSSNWEADIAFYNSGMISGFKGVIYFRHDTLRSNYAGYDFRQVLSRRWRTEPPEWDGATVYSQGNFVRVVGDAVYKALRDVVGFAATSDDTYWVKLIDISTFEYWNPTPDIWLGLFSGVDYTDYKLFAENSALGLYEDKCRNIHFESIKTGEDFFSVGLNSILANNVIFLPEGASDFVFGVKVEGNATHNTINGHFFMYNKMENAFIGNIVGAYCYFNDFGTDCSLNIISDEFAYNSAGKNFSSNTTGGVFVGNYCVNNVASNSFGKECRRNTFSQSVSFIFTLNNFVRNVVEVDVNHYDFTPSTTVYEDYSKTVFLRSDGAVKVKYINNNDALIVIDASE